MTPGTQNERVLRLLKFAGSRGITQIETDVPFMGGGPVRRLASRVNDLREAGFAIPTVGRRNKMAVYRLDAEPSMFGPAKPNLPPTDPTAPAALLEVPVQQPRPASALTWDGDE